MNNSFIKPARTPKAAAALTGVAAMVATAFMPSGSAVSAVTAECPDPKPVSELARGQAVTGLTVSEGTTPDALIGEVVGVIDDGIAQDLDLIMVKLEGSVITNPDGTVDRGIWAGMSGSPVYADDGRLIGAVSYGLSASPSDYAGVTPAQDMYAIQDYEDDAPTLKTRVAIPQRIAQRMAEESGTQPRDFTSMRQLPMPVGVSGVSRIRRVERLAKKAGVTGYQFYKGFGAQASDVEIPLTAGSNFAGTLAFGDTTLAGIGTTTAVCGDNVLAFGHPFTWTGPANLTMHGADALYVQKDTTFPSFKVANPAAPMGVITQDRLAGIMGVLGLDPEGAEVSVHFTSTEGADRTGDTLVTFDADATFLALNHALATADRTYDGLRGGSGTVRWIATFSDDEGRTYTLKNRDAFNSSFDITFTLVNGIAEDLFRLDFQRITDLHLESLQVNGAFDTQERSYRMEKAQVRRGGKWVNLKGLDRIKVQPGQDLRTRFVMRQTAGGGQAVLKRVTLHVPRGTRGKSGQLSLDGGNSYWDRIKAGSIPDLIDAIEQGLDNDRVQVELKLGRGKNAKTVTKRVKAPAVISGRADVHVVVPR